MFGALILAMCVGARGICTAVSGSGPTPPPPGPTPGPIQPEWGNSFVGMWYTNYSGTVSADLMPPEGDLVMVWLCGRNITVSGTMKVRGFLLVGGGGSGGYAHNIYATRGSGGGGGGGAMHEIDKGNASEKLNAGAYSIIVGKGGASVSGKELPGNDGEESGIEFADAYVLCQGVELKAPGGGGGGVYKTAGRAGGCGGGGSAQSNTVSFDGGSIVDFVAANANVYGNAGGHGGQSGVAGSARSAAAGGGGAGGVGIKPACTDNSSSPAGCGGSGKSSTITGAEVYYAGGGGGGHQSDVRYVGNGGVGGGGKGGRGSVGAGTGAQATDGVDGLGGGGGGQGHNTGASGKGGDGVVILRISGFE